MFHTADRTIKDSFAEKTFDYRQASTHKKMEGTKYNNYGARTGLASMMDQPIIKNNLEHEKRVFGDGFIKFKALNPDGSTAKDKPMNINGRTFYPDSQGIFTLIDEDVLKKNYQLEQEKREYLKTVVDYCTVSNENCSLTLGLNDEDELKNLLGKGKDANGLIKDSDLIAVDATPEAIETYDKTSITYSRALQKFKIVLRDRVPIVQSMTGKSVQNE